MDLKEALELYKKVLPSVYRHFGSHYQSVEDFIDCFKITVLNQTTANQVAKYLKQMFDKNSPEYKDMEKYLYAANRSSYIGSTSNVIPSVDAFFIMLNKLGVVKYTKVSKITDKTILKIYSALQ